MSRPTESEITELAAFNILEQEQLIGHFRAAVLWVGPAVVASRLDIEVSELDRRLDEADLTMTELRHLAVACEIRLSYNVNLGS